MKNEVNICLNDSKNKNIHLVPTLQPMCSLQHPRPPATESSNRQGPCIVSQLAHAERFGQKNTHLRYFVEHIPWQRLFCFCEWQLTDNSMWAAKIFPLYCLSPKLITVRLRWQRNQRQDGVGVGGWEGGGGGVVFIPPYSDTSQSETVRSGSDSFQTVKK